MLLGIRINLFLEYTNDISLYVYTAHTAWITASRYAYADTVKTDEFTKIASIY